MSKSTTRLALLTVTLGVVLAVQGCKGKASGGKKADKAAAAGAAHACEGSGLCADGATGPDGKPDPACEVMARVNGVPITRMEVEFSLLGGHGRKVTEEMKAKALDRLIDAELAYQRARELGLDKDNKYRLAVRTQLLRLESYKRNEMLREIMDREVAASVNITPQDAQKYFDEHKAHVTAEFHLQAIGFRDRAAAEKALPELRAGADFVELAKTFVPKDAAHAAKKADPWELGWVPWRRLPRAWADAVAALEPGAISDVVADPRTGIRIFKLLERRDDPKVTFEEVKNPIMVRLRDLRIEDAKKRYFDDLEKKAKVVRTER